METNIETGMNVKQVIPFFQVADIEKSVHWYVDGLGFKLTNQWRVDGKLRWCLLEHGGAALMLQEYQPTGHGSWVPEGKVGEGVTICFICEDAIAIYYTAKSNGIRASRPFVGNGMWVTGLADPDGYRIDFESITDAPEESLLAEDEPENSGASVLSEINPD